MKVAIEIDVGDGIKSPEARESRVNRVADSAGEWKAEDVARAEVRSVR